jgi:hypothetical protein
MEQACLTYEEKLVTTLQLTDLYFLESRMFFFHWRFKIDYFLFVIITLENLYLFCREGKGTVPLECFFRRYTVCPQSPFGVLKNCGAQTNWASHMRFAAGYSEILEVFLCRQQMTWWPEDSYQECDLGYSSGHAPQNMARARISSGRSPYYQGSSYRGLLRSVKKLPEFHYNLPQTACG